MNPLIRIGSAFFFVFALLASALPNRAEAGGAAKTPYVEWSNPPTITYGGWPVATSAYLYNPTNSPIHFQASAWHNAAAIDTLPGFGIVQGSWSSFDNPIRWSVCDDKGCAMEFSGNIPAQSRVYGVFGTWSAKTLGTNVTVGSITVTIDGNPSRLYAEGRANLVEGPEFSVRLDADTGFTPQGGYTSLMVKVADRTINNFQLLGVGAGPDCGNAVMPDVSFYAPRTDSTWAQWSFGIYVPDKVASCTITVLLKTKDTVVSASHTIRHGNQVVNTNTTNNTATNPATTTSG